MSCFQCSPRTFNYIISGIAKHRHDYFTYMPNAQTEWELVESNISLLYRYNQIAVDEIYGNRPPSLHLCTSIEGDPLPPSSHEPIEELRIHHVPYELIEPYQLLKHMQCVNYQCIDSTEYRESELSKWFKKLIYTLKDALISEQASYKQANWE